MPRCFVHCIRDRRSSKKNKACNEWRNPNALVTRSGLCIAKSGIKPFLRRLKKKKYSLEPFIEPGSHSLIRRRSETKQPSWNEISFVTRFKLCQRYPDFFDPCDAMPDPYCFPELCLPDTLLFKGDGDVRVSAFEQKRNTIFKDSSDQSCYSIPCFETNLLVPDSHSMNKSSQTPVPVQVSLSPKKNLTFKVPTTPPSKAINNSTLETSNLKQSPTKVHYRSPGSHFTSLQKAKPVDNFGITKPNQSSNSMGNVTDSNIKHTKHKETSIGLPEKKLLLNSHLCFKLESIVPDKESGEEKRETGMKKEVKSSPGRFDMKSFCMGKQKVQLYQVSDKSASISKRIFMASPLQLSPSLQQRTLDCNEKTEKSILKSHSVSVRTTPDKCACLTASTNRTGSSGDIQISTLLSASPKLDLKHSQMCLPRKLSVCPNKKLEFPSVSKADQTSNVTPSAIQLLSTLASRLGISSNPNTNRNCSNPFVKSHSVTQETNPVKAPRPFEGADTYAANETRLQSQINRHQTTVSRPSVLKCMECGHMFSSINTYSAHVRTHGGTRNKCSICGRLFSRSWLLKGHMRTHTGERPYCCLESGCDKAFADKSNLRSHMLIHSVTNKTYMCVRCGRAFAQKRYLHKHLLEVCR